MRGCGGLEVTLLVGMCSLYISSDQHNDGDAKRQARLTNHIDLRLDFHGEVPHDLWCEQTYDSVIASESESINVRLCECIRTVTGGDCESTEDSK